MSHETFSLDDFDGTTRLFPLPNLVIFPQVVQPLHIFESRYVEMVEDAIADDNLIAMGLLTPGWEGQYEGRPPVEPVVCLGRILGHSPAKDERYNILLGGIARARIVKELPARRSYREVELEVLQDVEPLADDPAIKTMHADLVAAFRSFIPEDMPVQKHLDEVLDLQSKLGTLTDLISYSLPLDLAFRQAMLAETDVIQRTRQLLDQLRLGVAGIESDRDMRPFPPEFSEN